MKYNKTNSCNTKKEMSERLRGLYDKVKQFINEELSIFKDSESGQVDSESGQVDSELEQIDSELEEINDIMSV